ncbi:MAG: phytanoyl-CoA dioxygenase family protein [Fimbriimonadaceae bacterium]|nr:phytanoyl-CoA dioxygenase family protein [Fimbriimonadaceae bacterium]
MLRGALRPDRLERINAWIDSHDLDSLQPGQWIGDVEVHRYGSKDGVNFQNIIEGGPVFEELIDHAAWIDQVRRYIEVDDHWLSIEENFLNVRESGGYIPIHSGGQLVRFTSDFRNSAGRWAVGQINILMALNDIGEGDGPTTVVPGGHKSHEDHPQRKTAWNPDRQTSGAEAVGMVQVPLKAGDALMFTDAITHGSMPRTNPGQRRVLIYRYAPHLLANRFHYLPSPELLARLTPERRRLVMSVPPRFRPGRAVTGADFEGFEWRQT